MWPILPCTQVFNVIMRHKFRFKKLHRIKSAKLFQFVYKNGHSVVDPMGVLYVLPQEGSSCKLGLAVGKKLGNAVVRNHVKRMMREVYRTNRSELQRDAYIIWVARHKLVKADIKTYQRVFLRLSKRAGLL
jgi:ribonuclease P protein component